ncbi:MAG: C39 family peptidase [Phototrophicaceae bacterium]
MQKLLWRSVMFIAILLIPIAAVAAQDDAQSPLPSAYTIQGLRYEAQMWNNCGPATITNALTLFGYSDNQVRAQNFLKPNIEDKNVSPWQMIEYVNTQVPEISVFALQRNGGTVDTLRTLIANNFPVIIEEGYDPPELGAGWMGHYLLVKGYDDNTRTFMTDDSYEGQNYSYTYAHIEEFWQHFNYTYIVLYSADREAELMALLGDDADEFTNMINALTIATNEAQVDNLDSFAWFNIGTNYVDLANFERENGNETIALSYYDNAKLAFDRAREIGIPWRMMWYQFGIYETYYEVAQASDDPALSNGLYVEIISLARETIQNCQNPNGICYVEETYYYAGLARAALGETQNALTNLNTALQVNSNFQPAIDARDALLTSASSQ